MSAESVFTSTTPLHQGLAAAAVGGHEEAVVLEPDAESRVAVLQDRPAALPLTDVGDPAAHENGLRPHLFGVGDDVRQGCLLGQLDFGAEALGGGGVSGRGQKSGEGDGSVHDGTHGHRHIPSGVVLHGGWQERCR